MEHPKIKENEIRNAGIIKYPGSDTFMKLLSEGKNDSHEGKATKVHTLIQEDPFKNMNTTLDIGMSKLNSILERIRTRTEFTATVNIYQEDYEVVYSYFEKVIEVQSVDGHTNVEDTFKDRFIEMVTERIEEQIITATDNDDKYDDHFQNK